jgi:hypothetical protein
VSAAGRRSAGTARRCRLCLALLTAAALGLAPTLLAGRPLVAQSAADSAADVASLDAILDALYASISGPKGQPRDFARMRRLFASDARLIPTGVGPDGATRLRTLSVAQYEALAGPQLTEGGFFEREIGRRVTSFGNVWHVMSAYESRRTPDEAPFSRGVNSIQLMRGHDRWWIVTVFWDSERAGNMIPDSLLGVRGGG